MIVLIKRYLNSTEVCLALTITALILSIPANLLPFLSVEMHGRRNISTLWESVVSLYSSGSIFIAIIILVASIIIPFTKLFILLYLTFANYRQDLGHHERKFHSRLYQFIEAIGRWSMLDIFLVAIMVAVFKFGKWTTIKIEMGAVLFTLVVVLTLLATASYKQVGTKHA